MKNLVLSTFIVSILFFTGCKKDELNDQSAAIDNAIAENMFDDVYKRIDEEAANSESMNGKLTDNGIQTFASLGCADSVQILTTNGGFPKTLTIFFNQNICSDGRIRNGKIVSIFTGKYRDSATVITTHFVKYTINGNEIHGLKTIKNNGTNSNGFLNFSIQVDTASIITSSGTISWQSTRNRAWTAGANTKNLLIDDEYTITGNGSGINRKGNAYTLTIQSPLVVKMACKYITQGIIDFVNSKKTLEIDYGNGSCDDDATVTINGVTYNIKL